jgi:acetyltransferase EpsM
VHINLDCTVAHDVVIEDFATISPGAHVSGNVILRQGAFIGAGTNIIEKIEVGAWSTVGAGSTVFNDIHENRVAVGVPARIIKKKIDNWYLTGNQRQE